MGESSFDSLYTLGLQEYMASLCSLKIIPASPFHGQNCWVVGVSGCLFLFKEED